MKRTEILVVVLSLLFCFFSASSFAANAGQDELMLASRITQVLKEKEPCWKPITVIESGRVPLVPSERRILVATWECRQFGGARAGVTVSIYSVESLEQATEWLSPTRSRRVAPGWQVNSYRIGDEGYLAKYKNGERFEIQFRKGRIVGKVAGNNIGKVREFADCIVAEVPNVVT